MSRDYNFVDGVPIRACVPYPLSSRPPHRLYNKMPRKAAASADSAEPRRSTRIKDLPKPDLPKKAPVKPRAKKAEAPKRGKKRSAEEANGDEPAAKKVGS